jgi:lipopolysaccharide cholinephosphotransferase
MIPTEFIDNWLLVQLEAIGVTDLSEPVAIDVVHRALLEALAAIDAACRALGVDYWLEAGTLLGAVRHGGPIPWDDDVDISMTRAGFARFVRDAPALLGAEYAVQTRADDPFIVPDAKVYVNGSHIDTVYGATHNIRTAHDGLFVDIFVSDPVSPRRIVRRLESRAGWLVNSRHWAPAMAASPGQLGRAARLRWRVAARVPHRMVALVHRWLRRRRDRRPDDYVAVGEFALFPDWVHRREDIFPLRSVPFASLTVPVPADAHAYLVATYGSDYLTPPPEADRRRHISALRFD